MASSQPSLDYSVAQKVIHWLMATAIILDLFIAQKFGDVMERWDRVESRVDHATIGTVVLVLLVLRLILRWKNGAPAYPADMPPWQQSLAHLAHWALYLLIGILVASGIASAMYADSVINPFGIAYGDGTGAQDTFLFIRGIHEFATNAIIALIVVHVVAALYHLIVVRDTITQRMLTFWRRAKTPAT